MIPSRPRPFRPVFRPAERRPAKRRVGDTEPQRRLFERSRRIKRPHPAPAPGAVVDFCLRSARLNLGKLHLDIRLGGQRVLTRQPDQRGGNIQPIMPDRGGKDAGHAAHPQCMFLADMRKRRIEYVVGNAGLDDRNSV